MDYANYRNRLFCSIKTKDSCDKFKITVKTDNQEFVKDLMSFIEDYKKDWEKKNSHR